MNNIPKEWLVDPVTKEKLVFDGNVAKCSSGKYLYNDEFGYWDFMPKYSDELMGDLSDAWHQLQDNGVISYENDPEHNLNVGEREDSRQFGEFCSYEGLVLDVGCGPQSMPAHIEPYLDRDFTFVGIDPLEGYLPRQFSFFQGLGEYLPFCDDLFDQVLFVTSLDHFMDPTKPLMEAKRVVKAEGSILIWIGEKDSGASRPTVSPDWYKNLKVPEGAEDAFHYKRFTTKEFEGYLTGLDLHIKEKVVIEVDEWRRNLFYRIGK